MEFILTVSTKIMEYVSRKEKKVKKKPAYNASIKHSLITEGFKCIGYMLIKISKSLTGGVFVPH